MTLKLIDEIISDFDFENLYYYSVNLNKLNETDVRKVGNDLKTSILN